MDINRTIVNGTLMCTLGDNSPIVFHTPLFSIKNKYFLNKSWDLLRAKKLHFLLLRPILD